MNNNWYNLDEICGSIDPHYEKDIFLVLEFESDDDRFFETQLIIMENRVKISVEMSPRTVIIV